MLHSVSNIPNYYYDLKCIYMIDEGEDLVVFRIFIIYSFPTILQESRDVNGRLQISTFHGLKSLFSQYYSYHPNI